MNAVCKKVVAGALTTGSAWMLFAAAPAFAGADVAWRIDLDTLPPAQRAFALTAPLGRIGPFGDLAAPGCLWSRIQLPTTQGLRWFAEENCNHQGTWDW